MTVRDPQAVACPPLCGREFDYALTLRKIARMREQERERAARAAAERNKP